MCLCEVRSAELGGQERQSGAPTSRQLSRSVGEESKRCQETAKELVFLVVTCCCCRPFSAFVNNLDRARCAEPHALCGEGERRAYPNLIEATCAARADGSRCGSVVGRT